MDAQTFSKRNFRTTELRLHDAEELLRRVSHLTLHLNPDMSIAANSGTMKTLIELGNRAYFFVGVSVKK